MRKEVKGVIAILCSDIHLSHKPPVARSAEPNWYYAMVRPLLEIDRLREVYGGVPVVCAGDIFDHWKSPPELINFAIQWLPASMYAIPGQHDLAYHSLEDIKKSAYWTLVQSGTIENLSEGIPIAAGDDGYLHLWGVPWNCKIPDTDGMMEEGEIHLAVIHAYNWMKGKSYPGAPVEGRCIQWQKKLKAFTASVFGDNHKGFMFGKHMMNCGTLMRRKIDERSYHPQVGLLTKWGRIIPWELDTSEDMFIDVDNLAKMAEKGLEMSDFLSELSSLGDKALNFFDALKRFCKDNGVDKRTERIILEAMEKKGD
jgi:hypothetical protein